MTPAELLEALRAIAQPEAVDLAECCRRLGWSRRAGERLLREGRFPIPRLPDYGMRVVRFSTADIDRYLDMAATSDARPRWKVVGARRR